MIPLAIALAALTTLAFCAWLAYCDTADRAICPTCKTRHEGADHV